MGRRILFGILFLTLFSLGWLAGRSQATGDLYANLDVFVEILQKVEDHYVDPVDPRRMIEGALKGMLLDLDPYSRYLEPKSYSTLQDITHGKFSGIGVEVAIRDHRPTVISPLEGTPAWDAGLLSGDVIARVNGESTTDFTVEDIAQRLRGPSGTRVRITIERDGESEPREVDLVRREIELKSVPYAFVVDDRVGYLRLANFSENSGTEVRAALKRLHDAGATSIVLDMRRNPGGLLDQAVDVAEQFLPHGAQIVSTRGRARGQNNRYFASEAAPDLTSPMAVLVDEGSASASEIVAGALQDLDRALVVGRTTFGKGSVQSVYPLRGRTAALKLTTALYYTPSGRSIHRASHDTLSASDEDDEVDFAAPDTLRANAAADTADRPRFRTAAGRIVLGGGGITPDAIVSPDTLPPLLREIEMRGLAFRFATRWLNRHPRGVESEGLPPGSWEAFAAFLRDEKAVPDDAAFARERPRLERMLRRELMRRRGGVAGMRVALASDPVFQRAFAVLERAHGPRDVFASSQPVPEISRPGSGRHATTGGRRPHGERSRTPGRQSARPSGSIGR